MVCNSVLSRTVTLTDGELEQNVSVSITGAEKMGAGKQSSALVAFANIVNDIDGVTSGSTVTFNIVSASYYGQGENSFSNIDFDIRVNIIGNDGTEISLYLTKIVCPVDNSNSGFVIDLSDAADEINAALEELFGLAVRAVKINTVLINVRCY